MDFEQICKERFSVRKYSPQKVEQQKVDKLLELARLAPTARNNQPYEIYVAQSDEAIAKLREITPSVFDAPLVYIICSDEQKSWRNSFSGERSELQDIGIITSTMMYGALEYGLDSVYVCHFNPIKVSEAFNIPANLQPKSLLLVGYRADDAQPRAEMHFSRRPLDEFVHKI